MKLPLPNQITCFQQKTSTGVFDGSIVGFAHLDYTGPTGAIRFISKDIGIEGNTLKIALLAPTAPSGRTQLQKVSDTEYQVILVTAAGVVTSTAEEVVAAINSVDTCPIQASVVTPGAVDVLATTSLSGGMDPVRTGGVYRFDLSAGVNGGLFYFGQHEPLIVSGIAARGPAAGVLLIELINVDKGLVELSGETVTLYDHTFPVSVDFAMLEKSFPLMPGQAIKVTCNVAGIMLRVFFRPSSRVNF
jgi:hypothetical protein